MSEQSDVTNVSEFTVSEVSQAVKRTVEDAFGYVRVRGEISGFRGQHGSGHAYFAMKDEKARLEAVIWRGVYNRLKVKPEEGLEVIATGKITTYPGSSKYQIVIEALEPAGVGALMALLEERKKKLAAEGLFDPARKQLLPYLPRTIGVITSPTGAVIRDIIHRLSDRFPSHVLVWPVRVQGETSGREVAQAITGFNSANELTGVPKPDLIIVARGGGSLEDLWGFNDEAIVRAAANSDIPIISAVGHETDWTLIDYAADVRAPTPTGAAEMAVPVRLDLLATIDDLDKRNRGAVTRNVQNMRNVLNGLSRALPNREQLLALHRQRLDEASSRLPRALSVMMRDVSNRLATVRAKLSPRALEQQSQVLKSRLLVLDNKLIGGLQNRAVSGRQLLNTVSARLKPDGLNYKIAERRQVIARLSELSSRAISQSLEKHKTKVEQQAALLNLVSYQGVLSRGFALVRDGAGEPVRSANTMAAGESYNVQFADGNRQVTAQEGDAAKPVPKPLSKPKREKPKDSGQGQLF